jgi:hypothetical protein
MTVLLVTIPVSLLLAAGFILFFLHLARTDASDPDRDGLLPLDDDANASIGAASRRPPLPPVSPSPPPR